MAKELNSISEGAMLVVDALGWKQGEFFLLHFFDPAHKCGLE